MSLEVCVYAGFLLDAVDMLRLVMSLIRIFLVSHYDLVLRLQFAIVIAISIVILV